MNMIQRAAHKKPGAAALIAAVLITLAGGAVPILQAVEPRLDDRPTRTATVLEVQQSDRRASRRGRTVEFELDDGTRGGVYLHRRLFYPRAGDTIEVYWQQDRWMTPEAFPWGSAVGGIVVGGFGVSLVVGWFVLRRNAARAGLDRRSGPAG